MAGFDGSNKLIAIGAASALTVAAVAAGVYTGVIPHPTFAPEAPSMAAASPPSAATPAPIRKRAVTKTSSPNNDVASAQATPPPGSQAPSATCTNCGVVDTIDSFTEKGPASGGGAVAGGLLGGILGHQIGKGRGKDLATVAGAVGGALAGNAIEKNANQVTRYHVAVRMSDGTQQVFTLNAAPSLAVGDRVVIVNGAPVRQ